jgi:hypothetical protein
MTTSTTRTPPQPTGPDQTAPPGWTWQVQFRRSRRDLWEVLFTAPSAAEAWSLMCDHPFTGHYHPRLVRVENADPPTLFDCQPAAG